MATTYLSRTQGTGNRQIFTYSAWIKRSDLGQGFLFQGYTSTSSFVHIKFDSNNKLQVFGKTGGSDQMDLVTSRVFRDVGSFYNVVVAIDTTQTTDTNRVKVYINGVQETSFSTTSYPSVNANLEINVSGYTNYIGAQYGTQAYYGGLMSYVAFVDGTQELPGIFGETDSTTGEWEIKTGITPSVAWGNNGFLILKNGNSLTDESSNSNNFTLGGGTLTKTEDCPSNVFATMNRASPTTTVYTNMANGNLYNGDQSPNYWNSIPGTLAASSGKFYWEVKIEGVWGTTSQTSQRHGIANLNVDLNQKVGSTGDVAWTDDPIAAGWQNSSGVRYSNSVTGTSDYPSYVVNDILMFAMDLDNLKLYLGKNGTWQNSGNPTSGASGTGAYTIPIAGIWTPYSETKYGSDVISWNCGNGHFRTTAISSAGTAASTPGIFEYDVPTSYQPMSTKGLNS